MYIILPLNKNDTTNSFLNKKLIFFKNSDM